MKVASLRIGGDPREWRELGFEVGAEGVVMAGPVRLELASAARPGAIDSWALEGTGVPESIDGLATEAAARGGPAAAHPNGVLEIDHVVVATP